MNNPLKGDLGDCRFYRQEYPETDELVMVKVNRIAEMGAYVSLLEYNNMEGMILMSELSKRRFRSVNKLIRVGRHEVVLVLRVDPQKRYIDLSKRRVTPEDIVKCEERYSKSKKVHQTVRHVAQRHHLKVDQLNSDVIWPLYDKYGHALDALEEAAVNSDEIFKDFNINDDVKQCLLNDIKLRLAPQPLKLRVKVDVRCYGYEGVDAVMRALLKGKETGDDQVQIQIKLIAPPQYVIVTSCYDKEKGKAKLMEAMDAIQKSISEVEYGEYLQQGDIVVIGEEERRLEELFEESESEEDSEEEDEGMGKVEGDVPEDEISEGDKSS